MEKLRSFPVAISFFSPTRMSSLEEPLGLGDLPKLSINRLGSFSQPSAYRRAAADDRNTRE